MKRVLTLILAVAFLSSCTEVVFQEAQPAGVKALKDTLEAVKRATTLKWKKQEVQINKLDMNTTNFYGELKAIVTNLPELEEIEGNLISDGKQEDDTLI